MKKALVSFVLVMFIVSSFISSTAMAAGKAGMPCSKLSSSITVSGIKYTCVKTKGKKVWNKGDRVAKPISKPSAKPITFTDAIQSPIVNGKFPIEDITFPIPTSLPTNWEDLYENRLGISYKAWLSISQEISASKSSLGKISVTKGTNTNLPFPELESAMVLVSKAFTRVAQPNFVTLIAFNYKDKSWADNLFREVISSESEFFRQAYQNSVVDMCNTSRGVCWSAMGLTKKNGDGIILLGIVEREELKTLDPSYSAYIRSEEGLTIAHEYFHTIQKKIVGANFYQQKFSAPSWFAESTAVFVENGALNSGSYQKYMRFRAADSKFAYPSCGSTAQGCIEISEDYLKNYLSLKHFSTNWDNFPYEMKYGVSHRVIEILVAMKGVHSISDLYEYLSKDHTFEEAFDYVYGISYTAAIPILAKIVSEDFANLR